MLISCRKVLRQKQAETDLRFKHKFIGMCTDVVDLGFEQIASKSQSPRVAQIQNSYYLFVLSVASLWLCVLN